MKKTQYVKNKGILVGTFTKDDLKNGIDKKETTRIKQETGLAYTNTETIRKNKTIVGLRIYVCNATDFKLN